MDGRAWSNVRRWLLLLLVVPALILGACGSSSDNDDETSDPVRIEDPWVKAVTSGMTGGFGTLHNDSDEKIVVTAVSSPAGTSVELHETVTGPDHSTKMQEKSDGFTIKPGGSLLLEPGADHIMLMGIGEELLAGDEVEFTLSFADDRTQTFTATVKDFTGANESYEDHGDMDHDSDDSQDK